jgi:hypothetical protein
MKKLLLTLAILLVPSAAYAQCNGAFPANTYCGNPGASPNSPGPVSTSALSVGVSPISFGAICNGSTSAAVDTTAFNLARLVAQSTNQLLLAPIGTCLINDANAIAFVAGGSPGIKGSGPSSIIKAANGANLSTLVESTTVGFTVRDVILDGNRSGGGMSAVTSYVVYLAGPFSSLYNSEIRNGIRIGIAFGANGATSNFVFDHLYVHDNGGLVNGGIGEGIQNIGTTNPTDVWVTNSTFRNNYNTITNPGTSGAINICARRIYVIGNTFDSNYNINGGQVAISDCAVGLNPIDALVTDNVVTQGAGFGGDGTVAFEINGSHADVLGNQSYSPTAEHVRIEGGANNVKVIGHTMVGGTVGVNIIAGGGQHPTDVVVRNSNMLSVTTGVSSQSPLGSLVVVENNLLDGVTTPGTPYVSIDVWRNNGTLIDKYSFGQTFAKIVAPVSPPAGYGTVYWDQTNDIFSAKNSGGLISNSVYPITSPTHQFFNSLSALGTLASAQPSVNDLSGAAALTKTDDTNVTLTLGGTPATALLQATSLTLGWTGTLAANRLNSNVVQSVVNDTNITGSIAAQALTLVWTGNLAVARGGTACASASGTCLDNITGFSSTGFLKRTGAGTYTFTADPSDVTSVSNSDSTLTISPTTGAVVASLNLAHNNTWTAVPTYSVNDDYTVLNKPGGSGHATGFFARSNGSTRWLWQFSDADAESGGNAGSDWRFLRYDDTGTFIDTPFLMWRKTGDLGIKSGYIGGLAGDPTLATGELGFAKIGVSGSAPAGGYCKESWVAGTNAGTCKKIAYCGTSTTPVTIVDNVGAGC